MQWLRNANNKQIQFEERSSKVKHILLFLHKYEVKNNPICLNTKYNLQIAWATSMSS